MLFYRAYDPLVEGVLRRSKKKVALEDYVTVCFLYASETGTSKAFSKSSAQHLNELSLTQYQGRLKVLTYDLATFGVGQQEGIPQKADESTLPELQDFCRLFHFDVLILCVSTWENGGLPPSCGSFSQCLEYLDPKAPGDILQTILKVKGFAVLGFGNSDYARFCSCGYDIYRRLSSCGGKFLCPMATVDEAGRYTTSREDWQARFLEGLEKMILGSPSFTSPRHPLHDKKDTMLLLLSGDDPSLGSESQGTTAFESDDPSSSVDGDGVTQKYHEAPIDFCSSKKQDVEDLVQPETLDKRSMLSELQRQQLVKEGYKIVGSHSAVKLCRWTKAQLRGRGGCYKHSFYGIESYLCMEATPSLACANKCVFCWRHHKNPVGTSWKWDMDDPQVILNGIIQQHHNMIKQLKGVPGVQPERFIKAVESIKHCALSLVGEPIMYPKIRELLIGMHQRQISTFVVTNAQFPEALESLPPVTQLYVSVDAASPETLKAIDRPLFSDYWERFIRCLHIIESIPQRTVFRLTLVKKHNMQQAEGFGKLILLGKPDFIEIKAVTYSGKSSSGVDKIQMKDIPWHEEVLDYARAILESNTLLTRTYSISSEHQHSCCVLISHRKFYQNGQWKTWIDYPKFFHLVSTQESFSSLDYCLPSPPWSIYGSEQRGFDPCEERVHTKGSKARHQKALCVTSAQEKLTEGD